MAKKAARKVTAKKTPAKQRAAKKAPAKRRAAKKRSAKESSASARAGVARSLPMAGAPATAAANGAAPVPDPIANIPRQGVGQVVHDFLNLDGVLDLDVREQADDGLFAVIPVR